MALNFLGNPHYTLPFIFPGKMTSVDTICLLISTSRSPKVVGVALDVLGRQAAELQYFNIPTQANFSCCHWKMENATLPAHSYL